MKSSARPLNQRVVASDQQDTLACDLSPAAKEWIANPPQETVLDSEKPTGLSRKDGTAHVKLGAASASSGSKETQPITQGKRDEPSSPPDVFHDESMVTRKDQMLEKARLEVAQKKNPEANKEEDPGVPKDQMTKGEKAAASKKSKKQITAEAKAKAKELVAQAKAKAKQDKTKAKELVAKAKAEAKVVKAKAKAEAKGKAKSGKSKRKQPEEESKDEEGQEEIQESPSGAPAPMDVEEPGAPAEVEVGDAPAAPATPEVSSTGANDGDADGGGESEKKTFARRNRPVRADPAKRFDGIKEIFNKHVKDRVFAPSHMEVWCFINSYNTVCGTVVLNTVCGIVVLKKQTIFLYVSSIKIAPIQVIFWNHCDCVAKQKEHSGPVSNYPAFFERHVESFFGLGKVQPQIKSLESSVKQCWVYWRSGNTKYIESVLWLLITLLVQTCSDQFLPTCVLAAWLRR